MLEYVGMETGHYKHRSGPVHYNSVSPHIQASHSCLKVKHVKHNGNVSFEEVINIARIMRPRSMARTLTGTVKEILGTANSVGCSIEGQSPLEVQQAVENGEMEVPDE